MASCRLLPANQIGMLRDYIVPEERVVACPNQDVVYGFSLVDLEREPIVIQVPDFGDRFWVYQYRPSADGILRLDWAKKRHEAWAFTY